MPLSEDQIDQLEGGKVFTTINLANGFFHVPIKKERRKYTSFVTHSGQYEFKKVPFGLCNSPAIFCRFINFIFQPLIRQGIVLTYMDDLIIVAENEEEAIQRLEVVLRLAESYNLSIKWKKCSFLKHQIEFLGYEIAEVIEKEIRQDFNSERNELRIQAGDAIHAIQQENRKSFNANRKPAKKYNINDLVAITKTQFQTGAKLKSKNAGPYKITKIKGNERYDVEKIGNHEGPSKTSTLAEYMKPWPRICMIKRIVSIVKNFFFKIETNFNTKTFGIFNFSSHYETAESLEGSNYQSLLDEPIIALPKNSKTIFVEGNIGSGKSTLLNFLSPFKKFEVITEPVDLWQNLNGHNLLQLMYDDPANFAFSLQNLILLTMIDNHLKFSAKPFKVMERSIFSIENCFMKLHENNNNIK